MIIILVICLCYTILIAAFLYGISNLKTESTDGYATHHKVQFSIVIPFRNEAKRITVLLNSLEKLNYDASNYELIFVDDASEDDSAQIISDFLAKQALTNYRILKNNRKTTSPKKDAINTAISKAKFEWILTTDADCKVPSAWLKSYHAFIQKNNPQFVAGPVTYEIENTFRDRFELLDFLSLMGSTMGGFGIQKPFLCNGANLAYKKKLFLELNGFSNNEHIAGGDDIFMLQKAKKNRADGIHFLKNPEAVVTTYPQGSFKKMFSQRIRWAAKTSAYKDHFAVITGSIVFVMNLLLVSTAVLSVLNLVSVYVLIGIYILKFNIDFLLLYQTARFFGQEDELKAYFPVSLLYPFFNVLIAIRSFFGGYQWKGRNFKK